MPALDLRRYSSMWGVEFGVGSCHLAKRSVRRNLVLPEVNDDKSIRNTSAAILHATWVVTWRLRTDHSSQSIAGLTLHPDGLKTYNVPGLLTTALDFEFPCPPIRQGRRMCPCLLRLPRRIPSDTRPKA